MPEETIYNNTLFTSNPGRWNDMVGQYTIGDVISGFANAADREVYAQGINNMQRRHHGLFGGDFTLQPTVKMNPQVKSYYTDINTNYGYVNTKGITNAEKAGTRYTVNKDPVSGDSQATFTADGLPGARGVDRRVLGKLGDYTTQELINYNDQLKNYGYEIYLDPTTQYYMLRKIGSVSEQGNNGNSHRGNLGGNNSYQNLSFLPQMRGSAPILTDPIFQGLIGGIETATTAANYRKDLQKGINLIQPTPQDARTTSAYGTQQRYMQAAADTRNSVLPYIGNDAVLNQQLFQNAEKNAEQYIDKAAEVGGQAAEASRQENLKATNATKASQIQTANLNGDRVQALRNYYLNAGKEATSKIAESTIAFIKDAVASAGQFIKDFRLNRNYANRLINSVNLSKATEDIQNDFLNIASHPEYNLPLINAYIKRVRADATLGPQLNLQHDTWETMSNEERSIVRRALLYGDDDISKFYATRFQDWLEQQKSKAQSDVNALQRQYALNQSVIQPIVSNSLLEYSTPAPDPLYSFKEGGSTKNLDRLVNFARVHQREQDSVRRNNTRNKKLSAQQLDKELDRLNREQVLLLKQMFK